MAVSKLSWRPSGALGHEDPFPRPGPNGRCRFSQETFPGTRGNGRDAPIAAIGPTMDRRVKRAVQMACVACRSLRDPGLAIYLVRSGLVFFNIDYVRDRIRWIVDRLPQSTRWFILDAEAVTTIDSTAAAVLAEISDELSRRNLRFGVAKPRCPAARAACPIRVSREHRS